MLCMMHVALHCPAHKVVLTCQGCMCMQGLHEQALQGVQQLEQRLHQHSGPASLDEESGGFFGGNHKDGLASDRRTWPLRLALLQMRVHPSAAAPTL